MSRTSDRLDRLVGNGQWGGGMPLPLLFDIVLYELRTHGSRSLAELARLVENRTRKPERLRVLYPDEADRWAAYVRDGLEQLESRRIVRRDDEQWRLAVELEPGRKLLVCPARKGKSSAIYTGLPAEWEGHEEDDRRKADVAMAAGLLSRNGPGLRPLDPRHVEALAESMREFGWIRDLRVLVDQYDRVLDGGPGWKPRARPE